MDKAQVPFRQAIAEFIQAAAQPPDKLEHQPRLYALATFLGKGQAYDDDVVYAAAWLHDIGVFIGHRPVEEAQLAAWDHVAYAERVVPVLLRRFRFPGEKIEHVLEVIHNHLPSRHPVSLEGTLVRDADILEQLGAIGIVRTVSKVGRDTRFRTHTDALRVLQKNAHELPRLLKLPQSKELAMKRVALMEEFLSELE